MHFTVTLLSMNNVLCHIKHNDELFMKFGVLRVIICMIIDKLWFVKSCMFCIYACTYQAFFIHVHACCTNFLFMRVNIYVCKYLCVFYNLHLCVYMFMRAHIYACSAFMRVHIYACSAFMRVYILHVFMQECMISWLTLFRIFQVQMACHVESSQVQWWSKPGLLNWGARRAWVIILRGEKRKWRSHDFVHDVNYSPWGHVNSTLI